MYKWKLRRRKSCLTQTELVKAYEGPDFDLADRYGEVSFTNTSMKASHDSIMACRQACEGIRHDCSPLLGIGIVFMFGQANSAACIAENAIFASCCGLCNNTGLWQHMTGVSTC